MRPTTFAISYVDALVEVYGPYQLGVRSQEVLRRVVMAAEQVDPYTLRSMDLPADTPFGDIVALLLGSRGDDLSVRLMRRASRRDPDTRVALAPLLTLTPEGRRSLFASPRNKIRRLGED